jgi:hypothetical protein
MLKELNEAFERIAKSERFANFDWSGVDRRLTEELVRLTSNFLCGASVGFVLPKGTRYRARPPKNATEREKFKARGMLNRAVREGKVSKPTDCQRCGKYTSSQLIHGHHADYAKPLEVEWLCTDCHADEHARVGVNVKTEVRIIRKYEKLPHASNSRARSS